MTVQEQQLQEHTLQAPAPVSPAVRENTARSGVMTAGGVVAAALFALLTTLWMPRGPVTALQVWVVLLGGLGVGFVGGMLRTRWALLLLPLIYIAGVELTRLGAVGPTVAWPRLDNPYGILALIVGRRVQGLIVLPPLLLGVGLGLTWLRASESGSSVGRVLLHQPLLILLVLFVAGLEHASRSLRMMQVACGFQLDAFHHQFSRALTPPHNLR